MDIIRVIMLCIIITVTSCENSTCSSYDIDVYCNDINGVIVKKYIINYSGRPLNTIDIMDGNMHTYKVIRINNAWFDHMELRDSVSKVDNSFSFKFYRNDSLTQIMTWGLVCSCDTVQLPLRNN